MESRATLIRGVLQVALSLALVIGAIIGSDVVVLLSAMAVVGLLVWEFEVRRRRRA